MWCFLTVQAQGAASWSASEKPLRRPQARSRVDRRRGAAPPTASVESTAAEQPRSVPPEASIQPMVTMSATEELPNLLHPVVLPRHPSSTSGKGSPPPLSFFAPKFRPCRLQGSPTMLGANA